jgi:hypothetical protein
MTSNSFFPRRLGQTRPYTLVSEQDLTASYANFGSVIDMIGYNVVGIYVATDANASEDVDLKVLAKHTKDGDDYEIDGTSVKRLWSGSGSDSFLYYEFDIGAIPYIQIQAKAGTVGATAGDLTITINKKWRN